MSIFTKWFPPSWFQIKAIQKTIYIDPAYLITMEGKTIYHAGDTDFIPEMTELGSVDLALLPIGGTFTMDIQEAVEAALAIRPKIVIPMHRSKADPQEFKNELEANSEIKVVPVHIGEVCRLG